MLDSPLSRPAESYPNAALDAVCDLLEMFGLTAEQAAKLARDLPREIAARKEVR